MITISYPPHGAEFGSQAWMRWLYAFVSSFNVVTGSGTTSQRPSPAPFVGFMFFDTTIGKPVWAKTLTQYVLSDGTNA